MATTATRNGFAIQQHLFVLGKFSTSYKTSQWRCSRSPDTARHFNIVLGEMKSQSINCKGWNKICTLRNHLMLGSLQRILFLHVLISSAQYHHTFARNSHKKSSRLCFTCLTPYLTAGLTQTSTTLVDIFLEPSSPIYHIIQTLLLNPHKTRWKPALHQETASAKVHLQASVFC